MNTVHTIPFDLSKIHYNIILLTTSRFFLMASSLLGFPPNPYVNSLLPMRAIFPANFILFNLVILIKFDEENNLWAPRYEVFSRLLQFHPSSVQIFFSAAYSQILSETKFHIHTSLQENYSAVYFNFDVFRPQTRRLFYGMANQEQGLCNRKIRFQYFTCIKCGNIQPTV
jgi:hypothetical protein